MLRHQSRKPYCERVGLDIGSHTISGVEVVERGPEIVIRSVGSIRVPSARTGHEAPDPASVAQAIKGLWSLAKFESNRVVLALPPEFVYTKWLHLEAANEEELDQTARLAAARGAPFPTDDAVVDYRVLSSHGASSSNVRLVMLVAAQSSAVDAMLNLVESAGLEPIAIDVGAAAAMRGFQAQKRSGVSLWGGQPLAHCILGARNTIIAVLRGDELEFARAVPVGGNDFTQCIAESFDVSLAEAEKIKTIPGTRLVEGGVMLTNYNNEQVRIPCENVVGRLAREILRSLKFFSSQFADGSYLGMIGAATLSGGGVLLKGMDACLQEQGIDVTGIVNPFAGFSVDSEGGEIQRIGNSAAVYTTAVGLATGDYWTVPAQSSFTEVGAVA